MYMKITDFDTVRVKLQAIEAGTKPRWGSLNASELMCHFRDTLDIYLEMKTLDVSSAMPAFLMKWVVIYSPLPWPKGVKVPMESFFASSPETFEQDRQQLMERIDRFVDLPDDYQYKHPVFGVMSKKDCTVMQLRHFTHHFRQFNLIG